MFEILEIIFAPVEGEYVQAGFLAVLPVILSAINTAYGIYKSETAEEEKSRAGVAPPLDTGGFGIPQVDLSGMGQLPRQAPEYGAGGSTFGQAMGAYQPMRLGDVLRPQNALGSGQFSLGKQKRRFQ